MNSEPPGDVNGDLLDHAVVDQVGEQEGDKAGIVTADFAPVTNAAHIGRLRGQRSVLYFYGSYPEDQRGFEPIPLTRFDALTSADIASQPPESPESRLRDDCQLSPECILRAPPGPSPSVPTDIALGDGNGTVAYVNERGELICIVKMLDLGPSGLFRARPNYYNESALTEVVRGEKYGMGLRLFHGESLKSGTHNVEYVHDRWPRISSNYQKFGALVQWSIKDGKVIQHYTLASSSTVDVDFIFDMGILVEAPFMNDGRLINACNANGELFTTGPTAVALAGGPGGYVRFYASLFADGRPVPLKPSWTDDKDPSFYSDNSDESDVEKENVTLKAKKILGIVHEHRVRMHPGEIRTVTAIYHLDHVPWQREEVFSMDLIANKPRELYKEQRQDERTFMEEYEKYKASNDLASARLLLDEGLPTKEVANESTRDGPDLGQTRNIKPFSNWGGETFSSHRLFGMEWEQEYEPSQYSIASFRIPLFARGSRPNRWQAQDSRLEEAFARIRTQIRRENDPLYIDTKEYLRMSCYGHWKGSFGGADSSFLFRRHLQHLLLVTTIPIHWSSKGEVRAAYFFSDGHFLENNKYSKSSLFQFRFLVDMYRLLEKGEVADDSLKKALQTHIIQICTGHLDWCFDIAQTTRSGTWAKKYRPFGSMLSVEDDYIQGCLHFLKLFEAGEKLPVDQDFIFEKLTKRLKGWLTHLKLSQNTKSGLWEEGRQVVCLEKGEDSYQNPHKIIVPQYDLCQSVLIWQTLGAIRTMADSGQSCPSYRVSDLSTKLNDVLKDSQLRHLFSVVGLRNLILDRFSFNHTFQPRDLLQLRAQGGTPQDSTGEMSRRLIAVSRSGKQKPRFHWTADSMILCEGYDGGIFNKTPVNEGPNNRMDEWRQTLELQTFQHAALWKKPHRYILALILASNSEFSIDQSMDAREMVRVCTSTILRSVLIDGRVAEELEPATKTPRPREYRKRKQTMFTVPHFLLRQKYRHLLMNPTRCFWNVGDDGSFELPGSSQRHLRKNFKYEKSVRSIKKRGFYAKVNEANILENPCEPAWLFDDPDFFTTEDRSCDKEVLRQDVQSLKRELSLDDDFPNSEFKVIAKCIAQFEANDHSFGQDSFRANTSAVNEVIRSGTENGWKVGTVIKERLYFAEELLEKLRSKRERNEIKKRLIYVYNCAPRTALALMLGAAGVEKFYLPEFLERHQKRGMFLHDETRRHANTWVTELHFGFYSVFRKTPADLDDSSDDSSDEEDGEGSPQNSIFDGVGLPCPGREDWCIDTAAISIHFVGDLNDRYWTSHVLVYMPRGNRRWFADENSFDLVAPSGEGNKNTRHSQRKILEARWFAKATETMVNETKGILDYVAEVSGEKDNRFYSLNKYDSFSRTFDQNKETYLLYGDLIKLLFDVKDSLEAIRNMTRSWTTRAAFRETQPRWTRDDEAAYREEIDIWEREGTANVKALDYMHDHVKNRIDHITQLRQWLLDDLNLKEARVSNRSADDVRIFTYATVVFLPLSFASSIFSMGGAPDNPTVNSFLIAAFVALVATIIFVLNAGTPMRIMTKYKNKILGLPPDGFAMEHAKSQWWSVLRALDTWFVKVPSNMVLTARVIVAERIHSRELLRRRKRGKKHKKSLAKDGPERINSADDNGDRPIQGPYTAVEERRRHREMLRQKQKWWNDTFKVVLGAFTLPFYLLVQILHIVVVNLFDLVKLLLYTLPLYPFRRLDRELRTEEDERKSTTSVGTRFAASQAKQGHKENETEQRYKREKQLRELRQAEEQYKTLNLERFLMVPRIGNVEQHLQKGESLRTALERWRKEKEEGEKQLENLKRKYKKSLKKVDGGSKDGGAESEDSDEPKFEEKRSPLWRRLFHHDNTGSIGSYGKGEP
ncbi:uncharacterized protein Z518_04899 [Rhinocladiella mackenziei CBS 650.93]|uniref:Uncharacterized protein n=1 Tax=Rhinocladiella mackenziei CBS 650.93 TaxID=1442369 RepID=A0A0D2H8X3_9EURO|nr:uncharacterized protein Z518_04899 [Rhinocladiella mackenziei CBS 650.93]KIX06923.1 hypothetical protein Z518_04899 [Rhinocladiella mackenziei CBS 650.93]